MSDKIKKDSKKKCTNLDDIDIIKSFIETNDKVVFTEIYNRYKDMIFKFIRNYLYNLPSDIAEEILDEVFVEVYFKLSKLRNINSFKPWIYTIARYLCIKYIRKNKQQFISFDDDNFNDKTKKIFDVRNNTEEALIKQEFNNALYEKVNKLDKNSREIIILKFYNKLKYEEISVITKIPIRTLKRKLNKAFTLIKGQLSNEGYKLNE